MGEIIIMGTQTGRVGHCKARSAKKRSKIVAGSRCKFDRAVSAYEHLISKYLAALELNRPESSPDWQERVHITGSAIVDKIEATRDILNRLDDSELLRVLAEVSTMVQSALEELRQLGGKVSD
jgi:hypothetical protein